MITKKVLIIFIIIIVILIGVYLLSLELASLTKPATPTVSTKVTSQISLPPVVTSLPINNQGNTDVNASQTKDDINEISKLYPYLPYEAKTTLSTGISVDIVIPAKEFQTTSWTLNVGTYGIDFSLPTSDPNYTKMKNSFRETVNDIFTWEQSHGVNPSKIVYIWGNGGKDQITAKSWISEP